MNSLVRNILMIIGSLLCLIVFSSCDEWSVPKELMGVWSGKQYLKVRLEDEHGNYTFPGDTVIISIVVDGKGIVSGTVGAAVLQRCSMEQNRGWFGRTLNLATDYRFTGKLVGKIFPADTIIEKEISAPFNLIGTEATRGSLFCGSGFAIFPMSDLTLQKQ